ncbi:MAG: hypothetical protein ABIL09_13030, partial [Gemmatimonadota bacterium]
MPGDRLRPSTPELLAEGGSRFVGRFLWWVVGSVTALIAAAAGAASLLAVDIAVDGEGVVHPRQRHMIKAPLAGLVREVLVAEGEGVREGQVVVRLDEGEWARDLAKVEQEMVARERQREALRREIEGQRGIRAAEIEQVRHELARAVLQRERVLAENRVSARAAVLLAGWARRPLEELVPVQQATADLAAVRARLDLAEAQSRAL